MPKRRSEEVRATLPDSDPQKPEIVVYLCQSQLMQNKMQDIEKQLAAAVGSTADPKTLALQHTTPSATFLPGEETRRGCVFWHYLRVDVLYASDKEEHAKALYWLSKLFESVKREGQSEGIGMRREAASQRTMDDTEYGRRPGGGEVRRRSEPGERKRSEALFAYASGSERSMSFPP